jgi:hypothetical protein
VCNLKAYAVFHHYSYIWIDPLAVFDATAVGCQLSEVEVSVKDYSILCKYFDLPNLHVFRDYLLRALLERMSQIYKIKHFYSKCPQEHQITGLFMYQNASTVLPLLFRNADDQVLACWLHDNAVFALMGPAGTMYLLFYLVQM